MNVLFIVMEFIPINIGGVYRPLRFVNGLKRHGINPIVVTFTIDDNLKKIHHKIDENLMDLLNSEIPVIRIPLDGITFYTNTSWKRFKYVFNNNKGDNFLNAWEKNFYKVIPGIIQQYLP